PRVGDFGGGVGPERTGPEPVDSYRLELDNMSDAIRGQGKPLLGREDALGQARTIEALYRSAESGGPVGPKPRARSASSTAFSVMITAAIAPATTVVSLVFASVPIRSGGLVIRLGGTSAN